MSSLAAQPTGYDFPVLTDRVVDEAGILPPADKRRLIRQLAEVEQRSRHQLVVVTVKGIGRHDVADYARKLGNYWGIGRRRENDGVILLVAPNDRKVRIAVGKGLETVFTDAEAAKVMTRDILPAFRRGNMQLGIDRGVDGIIAEIAPVPKKAQR